MKILCIGPIWRGSNAGGLFRAFSRQGYFIETIDEFYFIPLRANSTKTKVLGKLLRKHFIKDYNREIIERAEKFKPQICFVYKGAFILPSTLNWLKSVKIPVVNFYPDVSFHTHGALLVNTLPLYDFIFTTKSFGLEDMKKQLGVTKAAFVPHGFDPEIHRFVPPDKIPKDFFCDLSFIGSWSLKKEQTLTIISQSLPSIKINIWGSQWQNSTSPLLEKHIIGTEVLGDSYAMAINATKINLGLLSERVKGASSGDLITSRTFHIPAAGGFLLHERNPEALQYFLEGKECDFFESPSELVDKIKFYLENPKQRKAVATAGLERSKKEYSLDHRASLLMRVLSEQGVISH